MDLGWRGDLLFGLKDGRDLCEGAAASVAREGDRKVRVERRMEGTAKQGRGEQAEQRWREHVASDGGGVLLPLLLEEAGTFLFCFVLFFVAGS